ncbi:MAG: pimeloyl-ACP methyl ester esterase BioH [Buchnera aphidicola (Schlechtendalia peitan)]
MKQFHWNTIGTGKIHLVLVHGWGFNSEIWNTLLPELNTHFTIHLVDLPGFGNNHTFPPMNLKNTAKLLEQYIPHNSILLGWSMGGLIVSKIALYYPNKIKGFISVASSPCFITRLHWPGIVTHTLLKFYYQLIMNYKQTITNFIHIQPKNLQTHYKEICILNNNVLSHPKPKLSTLKRGLQILCHSDLRQEMKYIKIPLLRIYGSLDTLVPKSISEILDKQLPNTKSIIIQKCAHAPFISNKYEFSNIILQFSKYLNHLK